MINQSPLLLRGQSEGVLGELVVVGPAGRVHPLAAQVAQRLAQLLHHVVVRVAEILLQVYLEFVPYCYILSGSYGVGVLFWLISECFLLHMYRVSHLVVHLRWVDFWISMLLRRLATTTESPLAEAKLC